MADQRRNQSDDVHRQGAGSSPGTTHDRSSTGSTSTRGDRERSIATGREGTRSPSSRRSTPSAYGYGPFSFMRRMSEDMDRLLEHFSLGRGLGLGSLADRDAWSSVAADASWIPEVETFRRGDKLVVRADLPGMKKDDVNVEVNEGMLAISGERCDEREENRDDFFRSERSYGRFYRAIPLPEGVSGDQCDATFKDGVLEVTIPVPKQMEKKARQVQIR